MSDTTDLIDSLAVKIAAEASPTITWNPTGVYQASQIGIFRMLVPPTPNRVVAINVVPQGDDPSMPLGQAMIQLRARGGPNKPTDPNDILDSIFNILHGATSLICGALTIIQINRRVRAPLGYDETNRWEVADQYYADIDYPPTALRPAGGAW